MTKDKTSTDKRFRISSKGVILDAQTGLEWLVGPDKDTDHYEAEKWIKKLSVDGGGWRMPTVEELENIYDDEGICNKDPVFKIAGWWIWASVYTDNPSYAYGFEFADGDVDVDLRTDATLSRVFAVRSAK